MRIRDLEIGSVIICDDIRKEVTNKEILIGVYTGDIVVSSFPASIPLAFWVELTPYRPGKHEFNLRLSIPGKKGKLVIQAALEVATLTGTSAAVAGFQITFDEPGELTLEIGFGDEWHLLRRKTVQQGPVVSNTPIPTVLSGPPSNS
jgi:hypothetical protein